MRDLIFISMENWDEQWRRNQFVCAELARRHPRAKILFLGVAQNIWRCMAKMDFASVLCSPTFSVAGYPNITFTRALRIGLERYQWGMRLNQAVTRFHLRTITRRLGLERPVLWLNPHWAEHLVGKMDESAVVYDITDDWISRDQPAWLAEQVRRQDELMCAKADAVIVCSEKLAEMKRPLAGEKVHLIPNGVDADHYRPVLEGTAPLPADATGWERPVFGYTGTIHGDRLDVELAQAVAGQLKRGTMVFIGPNHLSAAQQKRLTDTGHVIFHDAVSYEEIPQYMRAFDVCMTPHRKSPFVESLQPIKLWEYLAAGKPIVATDVAGFRDFPELVRLATGAEEFARQLEAAASEPDLLAGKRQAMARMNSWRARVDEVEAVLARI